MKFTKLFALGLAIITLSSCLDDSEDLPRTYTYTDYLNFNAAGTECTDDLGKTYSVVNHTDVAKFIAEGKDKRALCQFQAQYDESGTLTSGFTMNYMTHCFLGNVLYTSQAPSQGVKNLIQSIDVSTSGISPKYINAVVNVNYNQAEGIKKENFLAYVSKVRDGNEVFVNIMYTTNEKTDRQAAQPVSFDVMNLLSTVREQLVPVNGKVVVMLDNNLSITGEVKW